MCLWTKECNAFDTASLLIALLRASNIPARYVYGTIELPIDKVMNWVGGFTDARAAATFIASGGIPVKAIISGGEIAKVQMEHVWVEGWVDYIPYRGAVTGSGDTWIPLDASFKQYNYVDGIDVDTAVPMDVEALLAEVESQSTINSVIPSITSLPVATIQNQMSDFQATLNDYMAANFPEVVNYYDLNKTLLGYRETVRKELRFLPNTLPVTNLIARLGTFSELPETMRHKISFKLSKAGFTFGEVPLSYIAYLPEIAGKRITLSYIPATPADAQLMSDAQGVLDYLVEVIPELKIEGQTVASGNTVGMGQDQSFEMAFYNPVGITEQVVNTIRAGEYYAVGLDLNKVTIPYLYERATRWQPDTANDRDDRLGELLHLISIFYFARSDFFIDETARASDMISLRHPSESMVGMRFNAGYLFGMPMRIASVGLNIDVDRDVISAASKTNSSDTRTWFMVQKGLYSSALEHNLFESIMGLDAISAVKFLDLASTQGIPIYILDAENAQRIDELQIASGDKQDIRDFINAGSMVLVPQNEIQYFDYIGIGYIAIDLTTGAGAYRISGGFNGGNTVRENVDALLALAKELLDLPGGEIIYYTYKNTIENILEQYPYIADSPNVEFQAFTKWNLYMGEFIKYIPFAGVRLWFGQQILYHTEALLLSYLT